ncbi:MAG TPA: Gfo/Idh/MocA family oxidoreductase [Solirubrobacteraceae bacterium]|nr:Gfo/Idh/MocA family oxidoreductase [Solirubrobacteraceae bacterium]
MASEPVRIALVGAGRMGTVHLDILQRSETIELTGVVEPHGPRRQQLADDGLRVFAEPEELLAAGPPEGVLIAAPSDRHPDVVAAFAAAGLPMLCEKPLGVTPADARAAAGAAEGRGVLLQIGYFRRFVPALKELRERIAAGTLGEISQVACLQWDAQLPSEQFRAHSGGIAVDMGVHEFDQVRWLTGQEFDWLSAAAGPSSEPRAAHDPDSAAMLAGLSGGAVATISLGRRFPMNDSCWVEVWGTEGYERIPFMWGEMADAAYREALRLQAEAFARAVRGAPREGAGGADAVAALLAAELAAESLRAGGARVAHTGTVAT